LADGTYQQKNIQVRDKADGNNIVKLSDIGAITIDTTIAQPLFTVAGTIATITGLEPQATWQYSTDNAQSWTSGTGASFALPINTTFASNSIQVQQTDLAGNVSAITKNSASITTTSLGLMLNADTGAFSTDGYTNDATVNVVTDASITWEYTVNGTDWQQGGTGSGSFELLSDKVADSILLSNIQIRDKNTPTNTVTLSHGVIDKIDLSTAPISKLDEPSIAKITSDNTVKVNGVNTSEYTWEYSTDAGKNWTTGTGTSTSFQLSNNDTYVENQIQVKQIDVYGNTAITKLSHTVKIDQTPLIKISAYAENDNNPTPSIKDYAAAGVTGVDANNLNTTNAAIKASNGIGTDTLAEVQAIASVANNTADTALAIITAYADSNTNLAPSLQNYTDAGVTGVDNSNLAAVNGAIDGVAKADADTTTEVQTLVNIV
ncbi:MAG: hypothetical protein PSN46_10410, partial [Gammaproteobacteria bacterium]|nr:hypothetical protein [Gammaproteobacteria bacterium]